LELAHRGHKARQERTVSLTSPAHKETKVTREIQALQVQTQPFPAHRETKAYKATKVFRAFREILGWLVGLQRTY
jgi:hypothetical protein